MPEPLLEVKNLSVHFPTDDGLVKAVDGVSTSRCSPARRSASSGSPARARASRFLTVMGLINRKSAIVEGEVIFQGQDLLTLPHDEIQAIRGAKIAMIFQDPMTSLHPFYKVGDQIAEAIRVHQQVSKKEARRAGGRDAPAGRTSHGPTSAPASTRTSSPAACASAR